ncbi:MAG: hypothetical protein ACR2QM_09930 [Longimicrobiales bacterium]
MHVSRLSRRIGLFLLFLAVLATNGCATLPSNAPDHDPVVRITVANHQWADMTVFVETNGYRKRLGLVSTGQETVFRFPSHRVSRGTTFRLIADPVGSTAVMVSEPIPIQPGITPVWILGITPALNSLHRR